MRVTGEDLKNSCIASTCHARWHARQYEWYWWSMAQFQYLEDLRWGMTFSPAGRTQRNRFLGIGRTVRKYIFYEDKNGIEIETCFGTCSYYGIMRSSNSQLLNERCLLEKNAGSLSEGIDIIQHLNALSTSNYARKMWTKNEFSILYYHG
jgi:hypothetical protein